MTAADVVDAHFQRLITKCDERGRPAALPRNDQTIYYAVATRCEMDINGFGSVFDQLLSRSELRLFIDSLQDLDESELADCFAEAERRLDQAGFFEDASMRVSDLDDQETEVGFLEDIERRVRAGSPLWRLDEKLAALIRDTSG